MTDWVGRLASERSVLEITGADARTVLQGVISNDIDTLSPGRAVYAALLTPQGKYLFDFFIIETDGGLWIDVAANRATAFAKRLGMYALRRDMTIAPRDVPVAMLWPAGGVGAHPPAPPPPPAGGTVVTDPRTPALGCRVYGGMPSDVAEADRSDYDALRVALVVPESGVELIVEDTYILEAGFERLNGVDFRKGCYVGQEVTARMKHKTTLRKGLAAVAVTGRAAPGTPIEAGGKPVGTLFTSVGGRGLAHLRYDRAGVGMTAGDASVDYGPEAGGADSAARSAASPSR